MATEEGLIQLDATRPKKTGCVLRVTPRQPGFAVQLERASSAAGPWTIVGYVRDVPMGGGLVVDPRPKDSGTWYYRWCHSRVGWLDGDYSPVVSARAGYVDEALWSSSVRLNVDAFEEGTTYKRTFAADGGRIPANGDFQQGGDDPNGSDSGWIRRAEAANGSLSYEVRSAAEFVYDSFHFGSGGSLGSRAPEVGGLWQAHPASSSVPTVRNGRVRVDTNFFGGTGIYYNAAVPASADQVALWHVYRPGAVSDGAEYGVGLRFDPAAVTGYLVTYHAGSSTWFLYRANAGSWTVLGSWVNAMAAGEVRQVIFRVSGTGASVTLSVLINGTVRISVTDSAANRITTAGRVLLWLQGRECELDDVRVATGSTTPTMPLAGSRSLRMTVNGTGETGAQQQDRPLKVQPGERLTLRSRGRLSAGIISRLRVVWRDRNGSEIGESHVANHSMLDETIVGTVTTPANAVECFVNLLVDPVSPAGWALYDDIVVERAVQRQGAYDDGGYAVRGESGGGVIMADVKASDGAQGQSVVKGGQEVSGADGQTVTYGPFAGPPKIYGYRGGISYQPDAAKWTMFNGGVYSATAAQYDDVGLVNATGSSGQLRAKLKQSANPVNYAANFGGAQLTAAGQTDEALLGTSAVAHDDLYHIRGRVVLGAAVKNPANPVTLSLTWALDVSIDGNPANYVERARGTVTRSFNDTLLETTEDEVYQQVAITGANSNTRFRFRLVSFGSSGGGYNENVRYLQGYHYPNNSSFAGVNWWSAAYGIASKTPQVGDAVTLIVGTGG